MLKWAGAGDIGAGQIPAMVTLWMLVIRDFFRIPIFFHTGFAIVRILSSGNYGEDFGHLSILNSCCFVFVSLIVGYLWFH